jgi:hypothetical protein
MSKKFLMSIILLLFIFSACKQSEGYGGLATIKGKVFGKDFNSNGDLVSQDYIGDVDVYISKHGETAYFDNVNTSYDGSFEFSFLHRGKYDIWVFGDCDSCNWSQTFILKTVEISDKRASVSIEDIIITF